MAIKPTIYKLRIAISDFNREFYDSIGLTVALHPSENLPRMMARIVVFCLNAQDGLTFTKGLSEVEQPDIWLQQADEHIALWLEVGEPAPERIKKASRQATEVKIYSFNSKSETWWAQNKNKVEPSDQVQFYQLPWHAMQRLADSAQRTMDWSLTISGDTVYVVTDHHEVELVIKPLS